MVDIAEQGIYIIIAMFGFLFWFMDYRNSKRMNKLESQRIERETKNEDTEDMTQKLKQSVLEYVKATLTDYLDHELNYIKKELGWAVKLIDKDIRSLKDAVILLNQFSWGTKSRSQPPFITGQDETKEQKNEDLNGIFRDTREEVDEKVDKQIKEEKSVFKRLVDSQNKREEDEQ